MIETQTPTYAPLPENFDAVQRIRRHFRDAKRQGLDMGTSLMEVDVSAAAEYLLKLKSYLGEQWVLTRPYERDERARARQLGIAGAAVDWAVQRALYPPMEDTGGGVSFALSIDERSF